MRIVFFANTDWYLYNFRLALARELAARGAEIVMVSPAGSYGERLEQAGFKWIPIRMNRRGLNPLEEIGVVREIYRIYRRVRPDLVHHFTIKPVVYGAIAARFVGVRAVVNAIAGLGYVFSSDALRATLLRPFVRRFLRSALNGDFTRVIVQNADDRAELLAHNLVGDAAIRLIRGSGVNTSLYTPRPAHAGHEPPRVLLATRLLRDKGVAEFVEAADIVRRSGRSAVFLMAGAPDPGNPSAVSAEEIGEWHRHGLVVALGHVENMSELLGSVDIVVLPSYREGVPRILIEAASAGLPVIATDVPGCREIVEHGVNGLLVPPRNADALAAAIAKLLADPRLCKQMGSRGRDKVVAEFDERIVIRRTIDVYEELSPHAALLLADAKAAGKLQICDGGCGSPQAVTLRR